jgi:hypothetical protein
MWDQIWAVPDTLHAILAAGGAEVEWFASPLNYSFNLKCHYTAAVADHKWGFQFDAYEDHSSIEGKGPRDWAAEGSWQYSKYGVTWVWQILPT